jgi:Tol biopolymer transport system component/DNA-binding winged helix-turn-helix (wHTH) protein
MADQDGLAFEFGPFHFDVRNRVLLRDGNPVTLRPKAMDVLLELLKGRGALVTKEELFRQVWNGLAVEDGVLNFQINQLRQVLGRDPEYIQTVPKRGFRIAVPVREVSCIPKPSGTQPLSEDESRATPPIESSHRAAETPTPGPSAPGRDSLPPTALRRARSRRAAGALAIVLLLAGGAMVGVSRMASPELRVTQITKLTSDRRSKYAVGSLLTDGRRIYFAQRTNGRIAAAADQTTGAIEHLGTVFDEFAILDINRTGSEYIAMDQPPTAQSPFRIVSAADGSSTKLGDATGSTASLSPDGQWIAYTSGREVRVVRRDGTADRRLAAVAGHTSWPRWSPGGDLLRFNVATPTDGVVPSSIWEVAADGGSLRRMLPEAISWNHCCGSWSPDGQFFVFQSLPTENSLHQSLWVLRPERFPFRQRRPIQLTDGTLSYFAPAFSADGKRLFALGRDDGGELVRFDRRIGEFVSHIGGISAIWVDFSRDGAHVVYARHPEGTLWRARADGSDARQLTFAPMFAEGCSLSPDGKWISFLGRLPGIRPKVYLLPADGGGEAVPISPGNVAQGIPSWSPDSSQVVFGGIPSVFGTVGQQQLQIYDRVRRAFSVLPNSADVWTARWSPDGRFISALTGAAQKLRLYDVVNGSWRTLQADHINNPTWSRDSRYIYYDTDGNVRALRRLRVADGYVEDIVSLEEYPITVYWWSGLARDDSPIILRNPVEIYAFEVEPR